MEENKEHSKDESHSVAQEHTKKKDNSNDEVVKKKHISPKKNMDQIHQLEQEIAVLNKECNEFKDKYLRSLAEMDNFRKRIGKEKEEFQKYALAEILLNLLQVLDNLERAIDAKKSGNDQAVINGVEITVKQFKDVLKSFEVQEIEAIGKAFDPSLHEALVKEERDGIEDPIVVEVYQKGYMLKDRLLRPALTKVATARVITEPEPKPTQAEDGL